MPNPKPLNKEEVLAKLKINGSFEGVEIGDVDFRQHRFEEDLNFSGAIFTGITCFEGAQFIMGGDFFGAKFSNNEGANFQNTHFLKTANFVFAQFLGDGLVNFHGAQFSGVANFECTQFCGKKGTSFYGAQFSGSEESSFWDVSFSSSGELNFINAKFSGEGGVHFFGVEFCCDEDVHFGESTFHGPGKVIFEDSVFHEDCRVHFDRVRISTHGILEFVNVLTLGNFLFLNTDLEKVEFRNVRFRRTRNRFFNREYLLDEDTYPDNKENYERKYGITQHSQVEILYRKLKLNFENQRDFARAGDFHYGEMGIQRQCKMLEWEEKPISKFLPFLKYLNLTQFYKIVSGYGEKWQQALASFLAILIVCTNLNLFWVEPKATLLEETTRIEKWETDSLHRLGGTALFTFKVLTLQRWEHDFRLKGSSYWPKFFVSIQHLAGPGIIALMLLAIRRKFRR
jgi:hypothetical protein